MEMESIQQLIEKYKQGTATAPQQEQLLAWYRQLAYQDAEYPDEEEAVRARMLARLNDETARKTQKVRPLWPRIAAAASILAILSVGGYFLLNKKPTQQLASNYKNDVAPGSNKAVLTLANGHKISVTDAAIGNLTHQAGNKIAKTADGQLVYTAAKAGTKMVYDTLTIPRGGQYQLKLADGSKVWLNAATSIRYPENFTGPERKVELIYGEAYFEVVHNARMPFRVVATGQTVEDIGTHFNISAYKDEPVIKTTLVEGSVKVSKGKETAILKPGQQSIIRSINNSIIVQDADTDEAVAWKNGYFLVNEADIASIMRQLARWYNIEVVFDGKYPSTLYHFKVSRNLTLTEMLKVFELDGINFKIEGRTLIVKS